MYVTEKHPHGWRYLSNIISRDISNTTRYTTSLTLSIASNKTPIWYLL